MNRWVWMVAFSALTVVSTPGHARFGIFGDDSREETLASPDARVRDWADSTTILVESSRIKPGTTVGTSELSMDDSELCLDQKFANQAMLGYCSGTLVAPDLILTAGHCVSVVSSCEKTRFVFGFTAGADGTSPTVIPQTEIYECERIVESDMRIRGSEVVDYALVQLKTPVVGHKPLKMDFRSSVRTGQELLVIGYPLGQPAKVSRGRVVDASDRGYFLTDIDTLPGSSGAPVLDRATGMIKAVHVRGGNSLVPDWDNQCYRLAPLAEGQSDLLNQENRLGELRAAFQKFLRRTK